MYDFECIRASREGEISTAMQLTARSKEFALPAPFAFQDRPTEEARLDGKQK